MTRLLSVPSNVAFRFIQERTVHTGNNSGLHPAQRELLSTRRRKRAIVSTFCNNLSMVTPPLSRKEDTPLTQANGPGRILRLYSSYEFQVYNISDLPSSTMSKYRVKKKKKNAPLVKGSTRNHGTRVQNFSIYLQKKKV